VTDEPLPRWAIAADVAAVCAALLGVVVLLGGGFRDRIGGVRISVTNSRGAFVVAIVLLAIRHTLVRRPSFVDRLVGAARHVAASAGWRTIWPAFAVSRVAVLVVGLVAVFTVGYPKGGPPFRISKNEAVNLPARWDAGWYLNIATQGYSWNERRADAQQNIAFFPAYPMLLRVTARIFGGSAGAYVLGGIFISHAAFLWALFYLHRLTRARFGDAAADRSVLLLVSYPFAVFHGGIYTESLFLLGTLGAIVEFGERRFWRAAAWGFLVGITRPNGFFVSAALAAFGWFDGVWTREDVRTRDRNLSLLTLCAPLMGTALFSLYMGALTGNPFQWAAQHAAWGRTFRGAVPLVDSAAFVAEHGVVTLLQALPYDTLNTAAVVFTLVLLVPIWMRLGAAYAIFIIINMLPPLMLGGIMSMGRLTSTMFPLFMWLGVRQRSETTLFWVMAFACLQGLIAVLFYTWRPLV
jgi:hypothetical protein